MSNSVSSDVRTWYCPPIQVRRDDQMALALKERVGWGGARKRAGRKPKGKKAGASHKTRPVLKQEVPLHVTLRFVREVGNARAKKSFFAIREAFRGGRENFGFRLVHYSVQSNHVHLIVEANDKRALSRGMKGLKVRIARALNTLIGRSGSVFTERYHAHALNTPREVRNALRYVLLNAARHAAKNKTSLNFTGIDPCSSGLRFDGWTVRVDCVLKDEPPTADATFYLLTTLWKRHGRISPTDVPGPLRS